MRRADRLLQIIQIFRRRGTITTANQLAEELEVSSRTIYRDMVALMASGVPITGETSVGYVLDKSYDLPPLMLTIEEVEALVLGAKLVGAFSQDDRDMLLAAGDALAKVEAVLSPERKQQMEQINMVINLPNMVGSGCIDLGGLRRTIRTGFKAQIEYQDVENNTSKRIVWPLSIGYFGPTKLLIAWCELREDIRNFRLDRIVEFDELKQRAPHTRQGLYEKYIEQEKQKGMQVLT